MGHNDSILKTRTKDVKRILIIVGPTSVGKSQVAIEIAKKLDGEIIGLDSRQIYRNMAIGTDQPKDGEREGIPHHLYGFRDPWESISAGEFASLVEKKIEDMISRKKIPIICGGSGLYFRALTKGLFKGSMTDLQIRKKLKEELDKKGATELLQTLRTIDPDYAKMVHPNNHKRLLRALEIYEITGFPPSEHFKRQKRKQNKYHYFSVYLKASLDYLTIRIEKRINRMMRMGWVNETKHLLRLGVKREDHSMDSLGYREIIDYLDGQLDFNVMVALINLHTRQFAKKQIKWFNKEDVSLTVEVSEKTSVNNLCDQIINKFSKQFDK